MALPGCPSDNSECSMWNKLMKLGVYNPLVRNRVLQAQYYKNQADIDNYLSHNKFLTDINNEFALNESYKKNLESLERFVMYVFENDTMVVPKESGV
jgi:palmitoyl-protein thioesterase